MDLPPNPVSVTTRIITIFGREMPVNLHFPGWIQNRCFFNHFQLGNGKNNIFKPPTVLTNGVYKNGVWKTYLRLQILASFWVSLLNFGRVYDYTCMHVCMYVYIYICICMHPIPSNSLLNKDSYNFLSINPL